MGVLHNFGTAGATGGGWSAQPGTLQPAFDECLHEPRWYWQARSPKTYNSVRRWTSLWSFGCRIGGGNLEGYAPLGVNSLIGSDPFEPFSCIGNGTQTTKFLKGTCVNSSEVPIENAIVQGFITADDSYIGQDISKADGTFAVGTNNLASVAHYLVAYKANAPDIAGTTVNTLLPTNIDGS